jgi:hypothetical protein
VNVRFAAVGNVRSQLQRTSAIRPSGRNVLGAALVTKGSKPPFAAASTNVGIWHKTSVQRGAFEGAQTGGLPTTEPERRLTARWPT